MGKVKYPNPKFFKAKDRMDWAAQAENLKLVGGIFWDMFKETDWKKFGEGWKNILISDRDRIKEEYKAFAAASMKDKIDLILNGERHLGRLYRDGAMCTVRREWRGIKDTVYDFYEWARLWVMLLMSFSKDLIPAMNQTLYYRWMVSYFCCHSFMDKNILGLRGSNLRMSHELTYCIYRYVAENLVILAKGDRRNGNSEELNSKLVLIDEMTMAQIMAGYLAWKGVDTHPTANPSAYNIPDRADIAPWALDSVCFCYEKGLLSGGDHGFAPLDNATRAQACVVLCGLNDFLRKTEG